MSIELISAIVAALAGILGLVGVIIPPLRCLTLTEFVSTPVGITLIGWGLYENGVNVFAVAILLAIGAIIPIYHWRKLDRYVVALTFVVWLLMCGFAFNRDILDFITFTLIPGIPAFLGALGTVLSLSVVAYYLIRYVLPWLFGWILHAVRGLRS